MIRNERNAFTEEKMIKVDREKCIECKACLAVCPFTVLEEVDGKPQRAKRKVCLKCMHCGAVCPTGAITYKKKPAVLADDLPVLGDGFAKDLKNHVLMRRSYRHFREEQVSREMIEEALKLAAWAPSAKNQHPTKWIIIESQEIIDKIMDCILAYVEKTGVSPEIASEFAIGNNVVMGNAKTLLLAYAWDHAISPETDTAIAMTTAELYLQAKGVGTCWAGYLKRMCNDLAEIKALLPEIPEGNSFYGALMLGYPEGEDYLHIPQRVNKIDIKCV